MSKKKINSVITILVIMIIVIVGLFMNGLKVKAVGSFVSYPSSTAAATTTVVYMTPGAATTTVNLFNTSTYELSDSADVSQVDVFFTASTTASQLNWQFQASRNAVDWFPEDNMLVPTTTVAGLNLIPSASTTPVHTWAPQVTGTSTKAIQVPQNLIGYYKRVVFSIPIGSGNGALWAEAVNKRLPGASN